MGDVVASFESRMSYSTETLKIFWIEMFLLFLKFAHLRFVNFINCPRNFRSFWKGEEGIYRCKFASEPWAEYFTINQQRIRQLHWKHVRRKQTIIPINQKCSTQYTIAKMSAHMWLCNWKKFCSPVSSPKRGKENKRKKEKQVYVNAGQAEMYIFGKHTRAHKTHDMWLSIRETVPDIVNINIILPDC